MHVLHLKRKISILGLHLRYYTIYSAIKIKCRTKKLKPQWAHMAMEHGICFKTKKSARGDAALKRHYRETFP